MVMAGDTEPKTRAWLHRQRFPVGGGINGLAAATAKPAWTDDYAADPRLPHDPDDESPARLQLGAVAVAPLFGIGGDVIGTLAITYASHATSTRATLLQELAARARSPATPACTSSCATRSVATGTWSTTRPTSSGRSTPTGRSPTWGVAGAHDRLPPEELLGKPFEVISTPHTRSAVGTAWRAMQVHPEDEQQVRLDLPLAGGGTMAVEISMVATMVDGRFAGAHGSVRDIRQRERLEQDLRRQAAALAANEERANLARELHDSVTQALQHGPDRPRAGDAAGS